MVLVAASAKQVFLVNQWFPQKVTYDEKVTVVNAHYGIIPKKDIKNIGEISEADTQYLTDAFFVVR